jgi:ParB/RepB/Spo0J family partition protein
MSTFQLIPLSALIESDRNPRTTFDHAKLSELAASIKAVGVHTPILVRPLPGRRVPETGPGITHEIIAGARRFRASLEAEETMIPAVIHEMDDNAALEAAIVENLQREGLSELDEAEGYEALMKHSGLAADEVGAKIGKSRSYVYARLKLLDLMPAARDAFREGKIDASKALLLARIPDAKLQADALRDISRENYSGDPDMGYRAAAQHVQRTYMLKLAEAKFPRGDEALVLGAGRCHECPKRTGANPDLFADVKSADVCTDPKCYRAKEEAHAQRERDEAKARGQKIIDGREAKALMPNAYNNRVEGYLRLDNAADSPTDKPLRALLAKQMVAEGVQPVLVANPHNKGELVAVLPADKVAELLKAKGDDKSADKLNKDAAEEERYRKAQEKKDAEHALESAWRWAVLEATWVKVQAESANQTSGPKLDEVTRHMALRHASGMNQDDAKKLTKLLGLGKVAPKDGLLDWVRTTPTPGAAMLLFVMFTEVGYMHWRSDEQTNRGLFVVAEAFGVDKAAIEAQTRANTRAAKASEKKTAKGKPADPPAAQASGVRGGKTGKTKTSAAPAAKKPKTSPEEAKRGIAAAMQGAEGAAASTAALSPSVGPASAVLCTGATVKVSSKASNKRWRGKTGTVGKFISGQWMVSFLVTPRTGEPIRTPCMFNPGDLTVVAAEEVKPGAADAAQDNEGAADYGCADQGGKVAQDNGGADIELGHRVQVVGEELGGRWGYVAGFDGRSVLVNLDDFASEYRFEPEELKSHGNTKLNPQAAWPFPKHTEAA